MELSAGLNATVQESTINIGPMGGSGGTKVTVQVVLLESNTIEELVVDGWLPIHQQASTRVTQFIYFSLDDQFTMV
jgi:hypothetical protein